MFCVNDQAINRRISDYPTVDAVPCLSVPRLRSLLITKQRCPFGNYFLICKFHRLISAIHQVISSIMTSGSVPCHLSHHYLRPYQNCWTMTPPRSRYCISCSGPGTDIDSGTCTRSRRRFDRNGQVQKTCRDGCKVFKYFPSCPR